MKTKNEYLQQILKITLLILIFLGCSKRKTKQGNNFFGKLSYGETFSYILKKYHIKKSERYKVSKALNNYFNLKKCSVGDKFIIYLDNKNSLSKLEYFPIKSSIYFNVIRDSFENYFVQKKSLEKEILVFKNKIESNIWHAMKNIPLQLISKYIKIFQNSLDFAKDIHKNDVVFLISEVYIHQNKLIKPGKILLAGYKGRNFDKVVYEYSGKYLPYNQIKKIAIKDDKILFLRNLLKSVTSKKKYILTYSKWNGKVIKEKERRNTLIKYLWFFILIFLFLVFYNFYNKIYRKFVRDR